MKNLYYLLFIFTLTLGGYNVHATDEGADIGDVLNQKEGGGNMVQGEDGKEEPLIGDLFDNEQLEKIVQSKVQKALEEKEKEANTSTTEVKKEEEEKTPSKPKLHVSSWLAEALLRGKGSPDEFKEMTIRKLSEHLGENDDIPALGLSFVLDTGDYKGRYRIFGFTYGKLNGEGLAEIEEGVTMKQQLAYPHLKGILDMPFVKDDKTARRRVVLKAGEEDSVQKYEDYKTTLGYTLTSKHTDPSVELKFTMIRVPAGSGEEIIDLKLGN